MKGGEAAEVGLAEPSFLFPPAIASVCLIADLSKHPEADDDWRPLLALGDTNLLPKKQRKKWRGRSHAVDRSQGGNNDAGVSVTALNKVLTQVRLAMGGWLGI